ncbi:MAG: hypothetical protein ACE1ZA_19525, partial [Pseudomonadales bacterium]
QRLHDLLDQSANAPDLADWARPIGEILEKLERQTVGVDKDQERLIAQLRESCVLPSAVSELAYDQRQLASRLSYAVQRRAEIWQPLIVIARSRPPSRRQQQSLDELRNRLDRLHAWLSLGEYEEDWVAYLCLVELRRHLRTATVANESVVMSVEKTLRRIQARELTSAQTEFLVSSSVREFEQGLWNVLAATISPTDLMRSLQAYDDDPSRVNRTIVVDQLRRWQSPLSTEYQDAVQAITAHYRNANLRLAVTEELINRLVPAFHSYAERVNDTILGAQVQGRNSASTSVSVALVPDPQRLKLWLHAQGQVKSDTTSRKGPVTMVNRGQSTFSAGKQLTVQSDGIFVTRT